MLMPPTFQNVAIPVEKHDLSVTLNITSVCEITKLARFLLSA